MFKNFDTDNWLVFWSIGVPVIVAVIGFIVSLIVNFFAQREYNRPIIFISFSNKHVNSLFNTELTIKNYGRSTGWIKEVKIIPEYKPVQGHESMDPNGFTKFKNFPLAPGQEIVGLIASGLSLQVESVDNRKFVIKYEAHFGTKIMNNKMYTDEYSIDEIHYPILFSDGHYTDEYRLNEINKTITNGIDKLVHILNSRKDG